MTRGHQLAVQVRAVCVTRDGLGPRPFNVLLARWARLKGRRDDARAVLALALSQPRGTA